MTTSELRAWRVTDPAAWNAFVEAAPYHAFPQLWEWGEVRAMGGWRPLRLAIGPSQDRPVAGAQLLLRRMPLLGWHLAYVPRGPIGDLDDPAVRDALVAALRALGRSEKIATVRADPEARLETPYGRALLEAPWRAAPKVQPPTTRVIDLGPGEEALKAGAEAEASAVRQQGGARRRDDRAIRRRHAGRGHRSGAGRLQPDLSVHGRARRLRRAPAVLLRARLVALRARPVGCA